MNRRIITHSKYPFAAMARINSKNKKNPTTLPESRSTEIIEDSEVMEVCSVVCNQPEFVSMLNNSLKKTCVHPWRLHIIDNGSNKKNSDLTQSVCISNKINYIFRECVFPPSRASQAHGDALNYAVANIGRDHSIMMLVDSDIQFVKKGWDAIARKSLPILGHVTTIRNQNTILPAAFISIFRKRSILNKKISFMPEMGKNGKAIHGKDVGHQLYRIPASRWKKLGNNIIQEPGGVVTKIAGSYDISIDDVMIASHLSRGRFSTRRRNKLEEWNLQCEEYFTKNN